jgi:hypothetical protein
MAFTISAISVVTASEMNTTYEEVSYEIIEYNFAFELDLNLLFEYQIPS